MLVPTSVPQRFAAVAVVAVVVALALVGAGGPAADAADGAPPSPVPIAQADAEMQASVLAAEERRATEVRTVTSLARWQGRNWQTPYRLGTATGYTLVLTPRSDPYTVDDLLSLAPQTFLRMSDGSYVLSEHLVVLARAKLLLTAPGGLTLRLASGPNGFATIVSMGGEVQIVGEEGAPARVTSWDVDAGAPDEVVNDGRSYVRAIGGQFEASHVELSHLGFWSGRTGGLALTGTDRPNTGAIEAGTAGVAGPGVLLDDVTWQPAGPLQDGQTNPTFDYAVDAVDYVSSKLTDVTVTASAFGLFVSGANGVQVSDSVFTGNALGGVVFHRYVTNGAITRTTSSNNAANGFTLARTTTGITISESTAIDNAGSGFSLDGRSLAEAPTPVGASLREYGNNSVTYSTAVGNGRYGIEVRGGFNVGVQNNIVEDHDMGIMVHGPAERIAVTGNTVEGSARHGVAFVDGVVDARVTGNVVDGSSTGIYLRDSSGEVTGNTVQDASSHGVSLVGDVAGSEVSFNVLAGSGASAFDDGRSSGEVTSSTNNADGWSDTTPWYFWFRKLLQPMTALWSVLVVLIVTSAIRSRRADSTIVHPYAHQMAHQGVLPIPQPDGELADGSSRTR